MYAHFQTLRDNRKPKGLRYQLATILVLLVMAKLCGEDRLSGIAEWAKHRAELLADLLYLKRENMPHHSTYRRILAGEVYAEDIERVSSRYLSGKKLFSKQVLVTIDGKVLRVSLDEAQNGAYLVSAYLPTEGIVLIEVAIAGKGSEIPAAPKVLQSIDLRHKVVMGDALHTQRAVSVQIVEAGGEYIWLVKSNHPQLEEDIRLWFEPEPDPIPGFGRVPKDFESVKETQKGHGRLEVRTITVSSQLNDFLNWPYLEQVFMLKQRFTYPKTGEVRERVIYGFTSLSRDKITPDKLLKMIRSYWGIENGLHYRRDVTL